MNLAQTQAQWTKFVREFVLFLAVRRYLEEARRRFDSKRNRNQIEDINGDGNTSATSGWILNGVRLGLTVGAAAGNTADDGTLRVRAQKDTPGAGQLTVKLYNAVGGGGGAEMANGVVTWPGTLTLAASNSSGLTGSVVVGTPTASELTDKHILRVFQDFPLRARNLYDGSEAEHPDINDAFEAMAIRIKDGFARMQDAVATALLVFWLGRGRRFLKSSQASPMTATPKDDQGLISVNYRGIVEDLRKDMVDELTAVVQTVLKSVVAATSGAFSASNQGKGVMAAPSMYEWALPGPIKLVCLDGTVGTEKFALTQVVDVTGQIVVADRRLTINRTFSDASLGIQGMLLTRTYALTGAANDFATATDFAITGESPNNCAAGIFYLKVRKGTIDITKWVIEFYKDATYVANSLVGHSNEAAAAATGVGINFDGGSGLGGTCKIGAAPTDQNTGNLNLQTFQAQNSGGVADELTVTITVTSFGVIQKQIGDLYDYRLNSATSGSETLPDALATAGTFSPFSVADV